jgi:hypothetical protein
MTAPPGDAALDTKDLIAALLLQRDFHANTEAQLRALLTKAERDLTAARLELAALRERLQDA